MQFTLFSSAFCGACAATRAVLTEAERLIPDAQLVEKDVVRFETEAEAAGIRSTPTVIVTDADGVEVFRAEGVPRLNQVIVAAAKAL